MRNYFSHSCSLALFHWFRSCGTKTNAQVPNFFYVLLLCIHPSGGYIFGLRSAVKKSLHRQNKVLKLCSVSNSTTQIVSISAKLSFKTALEISLLVQQTLGVLFLGLSLWLSVKNFPSSGLCFGRRT